MTKAERKRKHRLVLDVFFHDHVNLTEARYALQHILEDANQLEVFPRNVDRIDKPIGLRAIEKGIIRKYINRPKKSL